MGDRQTLTKVAHGDASQRRPTVTQLAFVTNGASDPTVIAGAAITVQRLIQAATIPFFRVRFKGRIHLDTDLTTFHADVTPNAATVLIDAASSVVRGGLVGDVGGAIPAGSADVIDIVIKTGAVAIDTADLRVDLAIHHDGS